jgi:hypothetical protein
MSTVKTNAILDASGGNTATINSMTPTADSLQGFRNRIINGDMGIDQRNAGASVTPTSNTYTIDRWFAGLSQSSKFSVQRSTTAPTGFVNSALITSTSAYSITSTDRFAFSQFIEGLNCTDLGWGTASAKTMTLSFQVRSSLTGTFGGAFQNNASDRSYPFTYTISAANTWETKTVTVAGDTTGTWLTNNEIGIQVRFSLGTGSTYSNTAGAWVAGDYRSATGATSVVGTNGATFYITGVQLEVGSVATPFERIDYGRELMLCQRYYYRTALLTAGVIAVSAFAGSTTDFSGFGSFPVRLRTNPSALEQSGTASHYAWNGPSSITCSAVPSFSTRTTTDMWQVNCFVSSGLTTGYGGSLVTGGGAGYLGWSAEL